MPSGYTDVYLDLTAGSANDIWTLIPTSVYQGAIVSGTNPLDIPIVVVHNAAISGTTEMQVEATFSGTGQFPTMFADFEEDTTSSFRTATTFSTIIDMVTAKTYGVTNTDYISTLVSFLTEFSIPRLLDIDTDFSYGFLFNSLDDTAVTVKLYKSTVRGTKDTDIELYLHNDRKFLFNFDLYCVLMGIPPFMDLDMESESGRVTNLLTDIYSALEVTLYHRLDMFSSAMNDIIYMDSDVEVESGRIGLFDGDFFSTASGTNSIGCDVRVWSLQAGTFFLDVGEYTTISATAWVDVVDPLKGVSTSGTYFKVNGVEVPVTFTSIPNGYRMYYDPDDNFATEGVLVYTAHIRNNVGDEKDVNYYLLRGFNVVHDGATRWPPYKQVDIWMTATNSGFCPNTSTDAYYFRTRELRRTDLAARIYPVGPFDLGSSVYPQSTAFFYGGTYTLTISGVRDYSGNEMDPFIHTFTIEDPTS